MQDSTALPDLRVLPAEDVLPHEDIDPRRIERLARRLTQERRLKNPPIVAPVPDAERFVVLDGANRTMALKYLGASHLVTQVVHYGSPGLLLDTWYHVVAGLDYANFIAALTGLDDLELVSSSLEEARESLAAGAAAAYIVTHKDVKLVCPQGECKRDLALLKDIVNTYRGHAEIYRASNDRWELQQPYYPNITALVIFPQLQPADILAAARSGQRVPSGITRHVIPNRALNLNLDIEVMLAEWSLEHKQAWLKAWIMEKMEANAIRFYAESTFSFDE